MLDLVNGFAGFVRDGPGRKGYRCAMSKLTAAELRQALRTVPAWKRKSRVISRTYKFRDFVAAMRFVNRVARLAEEAWHHPDILIRWNQVTLTLTTHDEGGLTDMDFTLAAQCDRAAR